jgi:hypothetical protein
MVPGSCLIIPFSIWALRVLGGDSECFLFLEGCVGSLAGQRYAPWGLAVPKPPPTVQCLTLSLLPHFSRICSTQRIPPAKSPQA